KLLQSRLETRVLGLAGGGVPGERESGEIGVEKGGLVGVVAVEVEERTKDGEGAGTGGNAKGDQAVPNTFAGGGEHVPAQEFLERCKRGHLSGQLKFILRLRAGLFAGRVEAERLVREKI